MKDKKPKISSPPPPKGGGFLYGLRPMVKAKSEFFGLTHPVTKKGVGAKMDRILSPQALRVGAPTPLLKSQIHGMSPEDVQSMKEWGATKAQLSKPQMVSNHMSPMVIGRESNMVRANPHLHKSLLSNIRNHSGEASFVKDVTGKTYGVDALTGKDLTRLKNVPKNARAPVAGIRVGAIDMGKVKPKGSS